jgi:hypothetical protein
MHSALLLSTFGCALFHAIHAFEFTGPDSDEALNLTQPITIIWDANSGSLSEPRARALELWFLAQASNDGGQFGWEIAANLSLSAGSYKWNPDAIVEGLKKNENSLSPDVVHYFEARLIDNAGSGLATVESEKYAVEGPDVVGNSGRGAQAGFYTVTLALTMAVVVGVANSI